MFVFYFNDDFVVNCYWSSINWTGLNCVVKAVRCGFSDFCDLWPLFSCLKAIRQLQKNGHIPSDPSLFKSYAEYGHFVDIRIAALEALVDYTRGKPKVTGLFSGFIAWCWKTKAPIIFLLVCSCVCYQTTSHQGMSSFWSVLSLICCPCLYAVERSTTELQWLFNMVQNDPVHYVRSVTSTFCAHSEA